MKIRLKALLTISILVLIYAVYYWAVPLLLNVKENTPVLKNYVKNELGAEIEIKDPNLKMGLIPSIWLDASYFGFIDDKSNPLTLVKPKIKIRLMPLLLGKIQVAYFSCDKINADLKIDKNYRLYIGDYLFMKATNPKVSIENSKMNVGSYEIKLKDEIQNKNIIFKGDYFDLNKYNSKKFINFSTNSKIDVDGRTSTINADVGLKLPIEKIFGTNEIVFDGTITNFNLADFSIYIKKLTNGNIISTSGILNIEAETKPTIRNSKKIKTEMAIENLLIENKNELSSISAKNKLNIFAICDFANNSLNIEKLNILSKNINIDTKGKINKINSKNPTLDLVLGIKNSKFEDIISLIPVTDDLNKYINLSAIKKYGYYADLSGKISVKGKSESPNIKGDIISSNAYLIKPISELKSTMKLKFLGDKLYMDSLVPLSNSEKFTVRGTVELLGEKRIDLDVKTTSSADLVKTKFILIPVHEIFAFPLGPLPFMELDGRGNIALKIKGTRQNPSLFGAFNFSNTTGSIDGIDFVLKNGGGSLIFKDNNTYFTTKNALMEGKPVKISGNCTLGGDLDYNITTSGQDLGFLINGIIKSNLLKDFEKLLPLMEDASGKTDVSINIKGKVGDLKEFKLGKTVFASGRIKLLGNNFLFTDLNIPVKNLFGSINFKNTDADLDLYSVVDKSKLSIKGKVKNKVLNLKMKPDDLSFVYSDIPIKIYSGNIEINNNKLMLYKVNAIVDSMPILLDGTITNLFKNPNFNIYINSKPTQRFIDKHINKKNTYPLKIKGDIIYSARIQGPKDALNAKAELNLQEDSSIYYMGSTLGDADDPIRIYLDTTISKNSVDVNNFQYDKLISSQNDKEFISPQLIAKGKIILEKNNISLENFRVKTINPTDAKIFNILFKRPLIKQGVFSSNVTINNSISSPKLFGSLNFTGINIPLLDTTIKDISLDFGGTNIDIKSKGEIFANKIIFFANMKNSLIPPYELNDVDIYLGNLDINQIIKSIHKLEVETDMNNLGEQKQDVDISSLVIKNGKVKADSVFVKNIYAKNLTADFSLNENLLFAVDNFKFDVAEGNVNGSLKYNLLSSNSNFELHAYNVNANTVSDALFDLPNQLYGSMTGQVDLTCNGKSHKTCMDTLSGNGGFRVANGRMPKLGSLEYLLKAANLVKSGITGITINSLIELVSPLKTGEFENINGNFTIKSGLADSIQIFSKGKDLSIFLTGTYNFSTLMANLEVYGRISKKITNILGAVGNTSLNTLFNAIPGVNLEKTEKTDFVKNLNKIPGFELNDTSYRIFSAEIYGDINGDDYVKSFKWVE